MRRSTLQLLVAACLLAPFLAPPVHGQPFGKPGTFLATGPGDGYVEIPSSPAFDVAQQLTIELWAFDRRRENGCVSFVSKGLAHYWVGHCHDGQLRSYVGGDFRTPCEAGTIPRDGFPHHFAMTHAAGVRRHYIDGELVGACDVPGPIPSNNEPLRFLFNPLADAYTPIHGMLFEVRFWNVARTQAQIRQTMLREIDDPMPGLVAVWHLRGNALDAVGGHHGAAPQAGAYFGIMESDLCVSDSDTICLLGRLVVFTTYQKLSLPAANGARALLVTGRGSVVPGASADSALFWFFGADNWEVLVKSVDACSFNDRLWVFSAATTDQHFTLWAIDYPTQSVRAYVNFAGAPAPAITDTSAFATCP
jgi:hypothetical protein